MKTYILNLTITSALVLLLSACGGSDDGSNQSDSLAHLLQVPSGTSIQVSLANSENLLIADGCSNATILDEYGNNTSINNPMAKGSYTLLFSEKYSHHNDSKGVYFYLSAGIKPNNLNIGHTYSVPNRETQIYQLNISTIKSYTHSSQRMNAKVYDSELNLIGFWNKNKIFTLNSGSYYIVSYPAYCTDGQNSFSVNEV